VLRDEKENKQKMKQKNQAKDTVRNRKEHHCTITTL
jgi:hypothetical protein